MRTLIIPVLVILPLLSAGQVALKDVQALLDKYNDHFQPEYAEVSLDKDTYFLGERIWYSLYVSDQAYRTTLSSAVAYVELRDARDSVIIRQKIRTKNGLAYGDIHVPKYCTQGRYTITAFTLWMKNVGEQAYEKREILVLDPDRLGMPRTDSAASGIMKINERRDNSYQVTVTGSVKGSLIALTREEVISCQPVDGPGVFEINPGVRGAHRIYIAFLDNAGTVQEAHAFSSANLASQIRITPLQKAVGPREKIEFAVNVTDNSGNPMPATINVSVRHTVLSNANPKFRSKEFVAAILNTPAFENASLTFAKESILYPRGRNTLAARQNVMQLASPSVQYHGSISEITQRDAMRWKVIQRLGIEPAYTQQLDYNLPHNFTFVPSDYAGISSLEDFFREAVSMVRIRKKGEQKTIRVRNSENPASIYFFKEGPLMLVDGFIVSVDQLLSVPIHDVALVNITWASREINSMNIYSVADNGVISVTTKSQYPIAGASIELFPGFHTPSSFIQTVPKNATLPMLGDPVWWKPAVKLNGKSNMSFYANDEPGTIYIHVSGFTELGEFVSGVAEVSVAID